jgi:hypothetical protein
MVHGHAEQAQPGDDATGNETVVFNQQDVHSSFRRGHWRGSRSAISINDATTAIHGLMGFMA